MTSKPQPFPKMELFKRGCLQGGQGGAVWVSNVMVMGHWEFCSSLHRRPWLQAFRPVFPTGGDCAPSKRQLAMSGDVSGCHNLGWEMFLTCYISHLGKIDTVLWDLRISLWVVEGVGRTWLCRWHLSTTGGGMNTEKGFSVPKKPQQISFMNSPAICLHLLHEHCSICLDPLPIFGPRY